MKNLKLVFAFLSLVLLGSFNSTASAQSCTMVIAEEDNGHLYRGGPRTFRLGQLQNDDLKVNVRKTGGRASATIKVFYYNNSGNKIDAAVLNFENGNYTDLRTINVSGLQYKAVYIKLFNNSATKRFDYRLKASTRINNYLSSSTRLSPQELETFDLTVCPQTVKVRRSGGNATGIVIFYEKQPGSNNWQQIHSGLVEETDEWLVYSLPVAARNSSGAVKRKFEVKNRAIAGKTFFLRYEIEY